MYFLLSVEVSFNFYFIPIIIGTYKTCAQEQKNAIYDRHFLRSTLVRTYDMDMAKKNKDLNHLGKRLPIHVLY